MFAEKKSQSQYDPTAVRSPSAGFQKKQNLFVTNNICWHFVKVRVEILLIKSETVDVGGCLGVQYEEHTVTLW